jgi:hypothetical protein
MRYPHAGFPVRDRLRERTRHIGPQPQGLPNQRECTGVGSMMSMRNGRTRDEVLQGLAVP